MLKQKKCKGTGKAKGYGCNNLVEQVKYGKPNRKYGLGLSCGCYNDWLLNTPEGKEKITQTIIKTKKQRVSNILKKARQEKRNFNTGNAMRLADMYFSRYIRVKYSKDGKCTCYTCGNIKPIKEVDNGHYQKREHKATRYNENNCRPQCKTCNGNVKHNGKQVLFKENLILEIGKEKVDELDRLAKTSIKADTKFFKDIAEKYRIKLNELQKERGIKIF